MITQPQTKCQTSSNHNTYSVSISEVYDNIAGYLMWGNDKRLIPINQISTVASALLCFAIKEICEHVSFEHQELPSDRFGFTPMYVYNKPENRTDFIITEDYNTYDTSVLHHYYTGETLDLIVDDIRYLILSIIYAMIPNTSFSHTVGISLPHVRCMFVTIHNEDMVECDEDIIHDGADCGLHYPEGFGSLYGD